MTVNPPGANFHKERSPTNHDERAPMHFHTGGGEQLSAVVGEATVAALTQANALEEQTKRVEALCLFILKNARNDDAKSAASTCQRNGYRLSDLENIKVLNISGRGLTELPPDIVLLRNLKKIDAVSNRLTTLPSNLNKLEKLEEIELNGNQFVEFPSVLKEDFQSLYRIYLANNPLRALPIDKEPVISAPLPHGYYWV